MSHIYVASGAKVDLLNPRVENIHVEDIAHHLSHLCRFTGALSHFYCVSPETRVLRDDLTWQAAGDLRMGTHLIAFDDQPAGSARVPRRRTRTAHVTHTGRIWRDVWKLTLSDGTVLRASAEHPWLTQARQGRNQKWETTARIAGAVNGTHRFGRKGSRFGVKGRRYLPRFFYPWTTNTTREAGYLAGMFDGEGCVTRHVYRGTQCGSGFSLTLTQKANAALTETCRVLEELGLNYTLGPAAARGVHTVTITGCWADRLRVLGSLRPHRLLSNVQHMLRAGEADVELHSLSQVEVVAADFQGAQEVVALSTSTGTYIAEGFGSHNSVAEHAVVLSRLVPERLAYAALHHDDHEYVLGDVSSPLKALLDAASRQCYTELATRWQSAIEDVLGCVPPSGSDILLMHELDVQLRRYEAQLLMKGVATQPFSPIPHLQLPPLTPAQAKQAFLDRHRELVEGGWAC